MKKLFIVLTTVLLLAGCTETTTPDNTLDCELYPNHQDCYVAPDPDPDPDPVDCEMYPFHVDCIDPEPEVYDFLDIFYMNDFHGSIEPDGDRIGLSGIASYIENHEETYGENTLVIAGGDMLQGSALSNYSHGLSTIEIMNEIGFDAFVLGNHEFDWGIETVLQYFDGVEENGEADFPLLAANVFVKETGELLDNAVPYVVYDIYDIQIGIIGTIGSNLEYSIAAPKVEPYDFVDAVPIIAEHAETLRTELGCEIVIWAGHDTGGINYDLSQLTGDQRIDAVFNGHSHTEYADNSLGIPEMQSWSNGKALGHVRLYFDESGVTSFELENLTIYDSALFFQEDPEVEALIDFFYEEAAALFETVYMTSDTYMGRNDLSDWLAELMVRKTGADIGIHNYGGTRTSIDAGEDITEATLYEVWPFDNQIKTVVLPGSVVNYLKRLSGTTYYTDIETFDDDQFYTVATNDYLFDKPENPFLDGTDITIYEAILRDMVLEELILQSAVYDYFNLQNQILTEPN